MNKYLYLLMVALTFQATGAWAAYPISVNCTGKNFEMTLQGIVGDDPATRKTTFNATINAVATTKKVNARIENLRYQQGLVTVSGTLKQLTILINKASYPTSATGEFEDLLIVVNNKNSSKVALYTNNMQKTLLETDINCTGIH